MNKPKAVKDYRYPVNKAELPLGPGSAAGVLIDVNSGWRTMRPVIDGETCRMCLQCWLVCPEGAIDKTSGALEVDYDYCKGCGLCARECRFGAIVMAKEGGEA